MTDNVYLNKDRSAVVDEYAAGKKFQVPRAVAAEMGLLNSAEKPVQERRAPFDASKAVAPQSEPRQKRRYTKRK